VRVPAGSAGELHAVADNLFGVSIGVLRAGAGLIVGGVVALIIAASSDWAPKPLRIAIVVGTVLTLALLSFLQGIS
jgi:hypothetical protein